MKLHHIVVTFTLFAICSSSSHAEKSNPFEATVQGSKSQYSRVTQQLIDNGFNICSESLDEAVKWVYKDDGVYGLMTIVNPSAPNTSTANVMTSQRLADGGTMLNSFSASPDKRGKCTILLTQTILSDNSCTKVRESTFAGWKYFGEIAATSIYSNEQSSAVDVFFSPTSKSGCLVVKRTVFY